MSVLYAQVIVDIVHENVAHTFTYRIPDGMTLTAGQRVEVPFGRMRKEGVVLSLTQETDVPPEKLRDILRPLEDYAAICPTLLTLAQLFALLIGAVSMLCAAAQALGRAFSKIQPLSLWLCALGALGLLLAAAFFGMDVLLCASPLLLLPEGILLVWSFVKR